MSTPRFTKAKAWIGKDLTIHIGGGDRKIRDNEILTGTQWAKFVGMGFLTQLKDEPQAPAKTAKAAPPPPAPPAPPAAPTPPAKNEGSVTKSSASKVAAATGKGKGKGGKGKGKGEPETGGEQTSDPASTEGDGQSEAADPEQTEGETKAEGATEDGQKDAPPQE